MTRAPEPVRAFSGKNWETPPMARKGNTWIGLLSGFIRRHPKTSATIAFNLGVYAALATKKGIASSDLKHLPAKVADLVPSLPDLRGYLPALAAPAKSKPARTRKPARKTAGRKRRR